MKRDTRSACGGIGAPKTDAPAGILLQETRPIPVGLQEPHMGQFGIEDKAAVTAGQ
jgi:hypothetical protein